MHCIYQTAVVRAEMIAKQADIIAALTLEVLKGTTTALDKGRSTEVHKNRYMCVCKHRLLKDNFDSVLKLVSLQYDDAMICLVLY